MATAVSATKVEMRILSFVLTCSFLLGCSHATKDFEALADRACQCAEDDQACGTKVLEDLVGFSEHHKASDGNQSKITAAGIRMNDCLVLHAGVGQKAVTAALGKMAD